MRLMTVCCSIAEAELQHFRSIAVSSTAIFAA
jgi:hypothetical protein